MNSASGAKLRALVVRPERPGAEAVAHGVDHPREVVAEPDPQDPGPEERAERAAERPGERVPERERQRERRDAQRDEQLVDEHEIGVGEEVGRELGRAASVGC